MDLRELPGASPSDFVGFLFFFFLRLVALCVSLWVGGVPLAAFSRSPALVAFLSSGLVGSPCCVFPAFPPCFLGGRGGVFWFLLLSLASCISFSLGVR